MMNRPQILGLAGSIGLGALALGCVNATDSDADLAAQFDGEDGKADQAKSTKLVKDLALDSVVEGTFERKVRTYGYVVEAKKGATLKVALSATAGDDAVGPAAGAALDTVLGVWGPWKSAQQPGKLVAQTDDDGDNTAASPITWTATKDMKFLVAFSSWEDTGTGSYKVDLSCSGTDYQCRRPSWTKPCTAGTKYVQGGKVDKDATWDKCTVVLLEPTTVTAGSTLTVKPGVEVQGNYLGTGSFGNVKLTVDGTLQAAGTPENPIAFTSLKADRGWGGLALRGPSHGLANVYVERAETGIQILSGASATIVDSVIEGVTIGGTRPAAGVRAEADVEATFTRAMVKGFQTGLHLANARQLVVEDSVVRENVVGVRVDGAGLTGGCYTPTPVSTWRDPVIRHSDIVKNSGPGVVINGGDVLLQIEDSNIVENGSWALDLNGASINPTSYVTRSNIHSNARNPTTGIAAAQVRTLHRAGNLDLSENYWIYVSDPELSASWQAACGGTILFTGFSPEMFADAGPRKEILTQPVQQGCFFQQQNP